MTISIFKNFVFFALCYYSLDKLLTKNLSIKHICMVYILGPTILCLEMSLCKLYIPELSYITSSFTFFITILVIYKLPAIRSLCLSFIAYGANLIFFCTISFLCALIFYPFHQEISASLINLSTAITTIVYMVLAILLISRKRYKSILSLLKSDVSTYLTTLLTLFIIIVITFEQVSPNAFNYTRLMNIFVVLLTAFVLILWWRTQITKSYRERLRILETEALRAAQSEQQEYVHQLENQNERMGKIIHKDNRLVNAMADAMSQYLTSSAVLPTAELQEMGNSLAAEIIEIRSDRQALLNTKSVTPSPIPQTGHAGIDAMITYMSKEAAESKIEFQFHYGKDFFTDNATELSENDLAHLLSDALENAIIATRFGNGKKIELSMLKIKGIPTISISDSGIPFEIDTYMNLGLQRASTHLDTGGSGIGLMDLWALKEKYKATLYIDEQPETPGMTKQVVYIFDGKNRYMISTNRFKEIQQKQTRADMFIVNPNTEAVI